MRWMMLLAAMAGAACGASADQLKTQAASDLKCSVATVETEDLGGWRERAICEGRELVYYLDGDTDRWVSPLDRAAFEMSCPKEQLVAQVIGPETVGVTGCGHKAVYLLTLVTPMKWGWVMNTETSSKAKEPRVTDPRAEDEE